MLEIISNNLIWSQAWLILLILSLLTVACYLINRFLVVVPIILIVFSFYFFRNPERVCPEYKTDNNIIICPADGKVVDIQKIDNNTNNYKFDKKVSIFLSPFDVHVNWTPIAGTIEKIEYTPGQFLMAFLPKSSEINERNDITIINSNNRKILVRQISGTIARKIVCWAHTGQVVQACYKYGMIKFGSRVDILLPECATIEVKVGQTVLGGQTILGRWTC